MPITCPGNTRLHFTMIAVFLPRTATASTDIHFGRPRLRSRRDDDLGARASGAHQAGRDAPVIPPAPTATASTDIHFGCPRLRSRRDDVLGARASGAQAGETPWVRASPACIRQTGTPALPGGDRVDRHSFRSPAMTVAPV